MGGSASRLQPDYSKEYQLLSEIVDHLLTTEPGGTVRFKDEDYNFTSTEDCGRFHLTLGSELKKRLRVDLETLKDTIYFVPDAKLHKIKGADHTKTELCDLISKHFMEMLSTVQLIKVVLDTERGGRNSLASVLFDNVQLDTATNRLNIRFCDAGDRSNTGTTRQATNTNTPAATKYQTGQGYTTTGSSSLLSTSNISGSGEVDLSSVAGLAYFCDAYLSPEERNAFLLQFGNIISKTDFAETVEAVSCGDALMTVPEYAAIYKRLGIPMICSTKRFQQYQEIVKLQRLSYRVKARSAHLIVPGTCANVRSVSVPVTSKPSPEVKRLLELFTVMHDDYRKSLQKVTALLRELTEFDKAQGAHRLKQLNAKQLTSVKTRVKKAITEFYLLPLINFWLLLSYAKTLPNAAVRRPDDTTERSGVTTLQTVR